MSNRNCLFVVFACSLLVLPARALQFTNYTQGGVTAPLLGVAYNGNDTFVAISSNGVVVRAVFTGGANTSFGSASVGFVPRSVGFGSSRFLIGCPNGVVYASPDAQGTSWAQQASPFTAGAVKAIGFNANRFVAADSAPSFAYSTSLSPLAWAASANNGASFLESYSGLTPYGASGFLACGDLGTIRISTDGTVFNISQALNTSANNLLGITSSGTLAVTVGGAGTVLYSSNPGGMVWNAGTSGVGNSLNGITYTGSKFVAVGSGGVIRSSTDGNSWGAETTGLPGGFATDLYCIGAARAGFFSNVVFLAGVNGTIYLGGDLPPVGTAVPASNCCYLAVNNAVSVSGLNSSLYTVDWYSQASGGTLLRSSSTSYTPTSQAPGTYSFFAQTRDKRTQIANPTRRQVSLTLFPRPTSAVSGTTNICNGQPSGVTAALTGTAPWSVTWASNGVTLGVSNVIVSPALLTVAPVNTNANICTTNIYTVTSLSDAHGCSDQFPSNRVGNAVVTVFPRPTANLEVLNPTVCDYASNFVFAVDLTGVGPWSVTWNDGTVQPIGTPGQSGPVQLTRTVGPTNMFGASTQTTNVYYVTAVQAGNGCISGGGEISGTNTIIVNPRPTANLHPFGTTVCDYGSNFVFTVDLTGIGPWTVFWNDGTNQTTGGVGQPGPFTLTRTVGPANTVGANAAVTYNYFLTAVSNADTCLGNRAGDILPVTNTIVVNPRPTANLRAFGTTVCDYGSNFVLNVDLTGIGPWTVGWNDGSNQTIGTVGQPGPLTLSRTVGPTNSFGANTAATFVYYLTTVSNADTCLGNRAGDIASITNIIVVNPRPTAHLQPFGTTVCDYGSNFTFTVDLTGIGPWTVRWNDGTNQTIGSVGQPGPLALTRTVAPGNSPGANAAVTFVYSLTSVSNADTCLGNRLGDIATVTNTIVVNPRPTASLRPFATTVCDYGSNFVFAVDLTGIGPWTVLWNDGTNQTIGSVGQPGPLALTRTVGPTNVFGGNSALTFLYSIGSVSNADSCLGNRAGDIPATTNTIVVNPRPTAALHALGTTVCDYGSNFVFTVDLTGIGPWTMFWNDGTNQTVGSAGQPGPFTVTRTVAPTNSFGANAAVTFTYNLTVISNADTCLGNRPGDIASVTNTIVVNPRPTANLRAFGTTVCDYGSNFVFTVDLTGIGPWTVLWNDGTNQTVGTIGQPGPVALTRTVGPTNAFAANAAVTYAYAVTSVSNADTCLGNRAGDIAAVTNTIVVNPRPTANLQPLGTTVCDYGSNFVLTVDLTGIGPWTVHWNDGTNQSIGAVGQPGPLALTRTVGPTNAFGANAAVTYAYAVTSVSNADTCLGNRVGDIAAVTNTIVVNPRPTASLQSFSTTECDYGSNFVFTVDLTGIGPWTVRWSDGTNQTVGSVGQPGPLAFTRTVAPTNGLGASTPVIFNYALTSVSNSDTCLGNRTGDIPNVTNTIVINPLPAAQLTVGTNDFEASANGQNLVASATNSFGTNVQVQTRFSIIDNQFGITLPSITVNITNHLSLSGLTPWSVVWRVVSADAAGESRQTNDIARTYSEPITNEVFQYVIATNTPGTNFTFSIIAISNACTATGGDLPAPVNVTFNGAPGALVSLLGLTGICNEGTGYLVADLSGVPPWTIIWSDSHTDTAVTDTPFVRPVTLTNSLSVQTNYSFYITQVTDSVHPVVVLSSNDTGLATITVDPVPCTNYLYVTAATLTNLTLTWNGNYDLEQATNLAPPVTWLPVTNWPFFGPNVHTVWTTNAAVPQEFFRLHINTNSP